LEGVTTSFDALYDGLGWVWVVTVVTVLEKSLWGRKKTIYVPYKGVCYMAGVLEGVVTTTTTEASSEASIPTVTGSMRGGDGGDASPPPSPPQAAPPRRCRWWREADGDAW